MKINLRDVRERDMDMLIMEMFICSESFRNVFIDSTKEGSKLRLIRDNGYTVEQTYHSLTTHDGESDMVFVLNSNGVRHAIFVEDKVNAVTMDEQSDRYIKRANDKQMQDELGYSDDNYSIFLAAPDKYKKAHERDKNAQYEYSVSYEDLRDCLRKESDERSLFKVAMIEAAIAKHEAYAKIINDQVTAFWSQFSIECEKEQLKVLNADQARGSSALFINFELPEIEDKRIQLIYKARHGNIDLQFQGYGDKRERLRAILRNHLNDEIKIERAEKSAVVRIHNDGWKISPLIPPNEYQNSFSQIMQNVKKLAEIARTINCQDLYD